MNECQRPKSLAAASPSIYETASELRGINGCRMNVVKSLVIRPLHTSCEKSVIFFAFVVLVLTCAGVFARAHRSFQAAPIPGYAWIASTDGTTTNKTGRVTAVLASHGIPSYFESMLVADIYVPTNQVAKARLVLLL